jgi:hypothetical protein
VEQMKAEARKPQLVELLRSVEDVGTAEDALL